MYTALALEKTMHEAIPAKWPKQIREEIWPEREAAVGRIVRDLPSHIADGLE